MEVLKELLSTFKEIFYDIFGYLLPGLFILFILCTPLIIREHSSFMYALYEILFNPKIKVNTNFINLFQNLSFFKILCISFLAYLLGHIPIYISSYLKALLKFLSSKLKTSNSCNSYEEFCNNILEILKTKNNFNKNLFKDKTDDYNHQFITTFASTYSRFTSHNDLIQKYICKINFYSSVSCIFFMLFIDSIISCFFWKSLNPLNNIYFLDLKMFLIIFSCLYVF
ncbi:hypothetical protein CBCST_04431 [Clostridium botulinum C str. Stockholm]|nr:hypothetical protein CBCST_04431 [Clostridium botulinum C str. Stockholm]